jgi:hypothetical protein
VIYWYVAVIVLVLSPSETLPILIPYKDEASCSAALPHLAAAARIDYPDSYVMCRQSDYPSGVAVRPQTRP